MSASPERVIEITDSHAAMVGALQVRRAIPRRERRTIGAWCFIDHIGPVTLTPDVEADAAPHPHTGLQTVTWLLEGEVLHRDSVGSEQLIKPGQLNLMTAGHGVVHSEEGFGKRSGRVHGIQLWVAQPEATRHGAPAFEHHAERPIVELDRATSTVLVGEFGGVASPARRDTDHVGADVRLRPGRSVIPLEPAYEYGIVVSEGGVTIDGQPIAPGKLAYLAPGAGELTVDAAANARILLIGGTAFEARISMFWNFVARTHDEIDLAVSQWQAGDERFGTVASSLPRIPSPATPW